MKLIVDKIKSCKRFLFDDLKAFILFNVIFKKKIAGNQKNLSYSVGVTVVITSCARPDKLKLMLESLIKYNTHKISKYILVEDAGCCESVEIAKSVILNAPLHIIFHNSNRGQLRSIDEAYKLVETQYVLHLEEDWEFFDFGFVEYSLDVMSRHSDIVSLSLRPHSDWSNWKFVAKENFYIFNKVNNFIWQGISINPGIYDIKKYNLLGEYEKFKKERIIVQAYRSLGYVGAISNKEFGYVRHIGENFSTRKKYKVA